MVFINYKNNNIINLKDIDKNSKILDIKKKLNIQNYFLTYNGQILKDHLYLKDYNLDCNSIIEINIKLNGGIFNILKPIFGPIIAPFEAITKAVIGLVELIFDLVELFINLIEMIPAIFSPDKLINDIIYAMSLGITSMIEIFIKNLSFGGKTKDEEGGKGIFGMGKDAKKVCIKPTFLNLIILVLCPPLALFLKRGMKGIFWVLVCGLMTYFLYYFPGLIFAALHIFC